MSDNDVPMLWPVLLSGLIHRLNKLLLLIKALDLVVSEFFCVCVPILSLCCCFSMETIVLMQSAPKTDVVNTH